MRRMADPIRRSQALIMFKQGMNRKDVAALLDEVSEGMLRKEEQLDPEWHDLVQEAIAQKFESALSRAYELAEHADPKGEMEGSHKALALIFRFAEKNLDREHATALLERKGQIAKEIEGGRPVAQAPVITGPDMVKALISGLQEAEAVDAEIVEEEG